MEHLVSQSQTVFITVLDTKAKNLNQPTSRRCTLNGEDMTYDVLTMLGPTVITTAADNAH